MYMRKPDREYQIRNLVSDGERLQFPDVEELNHPPGPKEDLQKVS